MVLCCQLCAVVVYLPNLSYWRGVGSVEIVAGSDHGLLPSLVDLQDRAGRRLRRFRIEARLVRDLLLTIHLSAVMLLPSSVLDEAE